MDQPIRPFIQESDEMVFNPNEYTEKELLKLVYHELHRLRKEFDDYRKTNTWEKRISDMEAAMLLQKTLREQAEKRAQRVQAYIVGVFTILSLILKFVIK